MGMLHVFILSLLSYTQLIRVDGVSLVKEEDCRCSINHPQQMFCDSDFAFVGTIESAEDLTDIYVYKVSIFGNKIFKGLSYIGEEVQSVSVLTPFGSSLCGRTNLMTDTYLFTGRYLEGKLVITYCDWIQEWSKVSIEQKSYLENMDYLYHCGLCPITSVKSAIHEDQNENDNVYSGQVSGLWTPNNCFFNPVSSVVYGKVDCETSYSYCHPTGESCDWKLTESYVECFANRESFWSDRHRRPAAALRIPWTTVKQCREIKNNRKMKRRCLSEVKSYLRSQKQTMDPVDMLEELIDLRDMWIEDDDLGWMKE